MDPGLRQDDGIVGVIPAKAGIQGNGKVAFDKIPVQDDPRAKPQPPGVSAVMDSGLRRNDGIRVTTGVVFPGSLPTLNRSLRLPLAYARMTDYNIHRHTGLAPPSRATSSYRRRPVSRATEWRIVPKACSRTILVENHNHSSRLQS